MVFGCGANRRGQIGLQVSTLRPWLSVFPKPNSTLTRFSRQIQS